MQSRLAPSRLIRRGKSSLSTCRQYTKPVPSHSAGLGRVDLPFFRETAFDAGSPLLLRNGAYEEPSPFPALMKWFKDEIKPAEDRESRKILAPYLRQFSDWRFPYELISYGPSTTGSPSRVDPLLRFLHWLSMSKEEDPPGLAKILSHNWHQLRPGAEDVQLLRFDAPFALFLEASSFNCGNAQPLTQLYIAQAPLHDLPTDLQHDVPIPDLVKYSGRGDVYDSSIWLGLEPTYTPWHRDPNPNLFCQLCGSKTVRLLPPALGEATFRSVQACLGQYGSSKIRGEEMMQSPERQLLHDVIWGPKVPEGIMDAQLDPGDALFIPKGWWHSVKSRHSDGRLNASVNWWFR